MTVASKAVWNLSQHILSPLSENTNFHSCFPLPIMLFSWRLHFLLPVQCSTFGQYASFASTPSRSPCLSLCLKPLIMLPTHSLESPLLVLVLAPMRLLSLSGSCHTPQSMPPRHSVQTPAPPQPPGVSSLQEFQCGSGLSRFCTFTWMSSDASPPSAPRPVFFLPAFLPTTVNWDTHSGHNSALCW